MGFHFLLQGIFPTQELNPGLLHCRQILYHLSYQGSPFISHMGKKQKKQLERFLIFVDLSCFSF